MKRRDEEGEFVSHRDDEGGMPTNTDVASAFEGDSSSSDVGLAAHQLAQLRIHIPGYQLLEVIGRGGQATVYKAIMLPPADAPTPEPPKTVAIKLLHAGPHANLAARQRMRREVLAMKALIGSPNIVCTFDSGQTEDGNDYLVMNYIEGSTLDEFWKHRPAASVLPDDPSSQLLLFRKICDTVGLAHRRGITHRDLSPSNIMVDHQGEPHILDFGLAKTAFDGLFPSDVKAVSVTGQFIGKLAYASPEQANGSSAIDIRTDVYALGVILYQIVAGGRFPYEVVGNLVDVLNNIIKTDPEPPSKVVQARDAKAIRRRQPLRAKKPPAVNDAIDAIVLKALAKDPAKRYQSAVELARDVECYMAGRPTAASALRSVEVKEGGWTWNKSRLLAAAVLSLALIAGLAFFSRKVWAPGIRSHETGEAARAAAVVPPVQAPTPSPPQPSAPDDTSIAKLGRALDDISKQLGDLPQPPRDFPNDPIETDPAKQRHLGNIVNWSLNADRLSAVNREVLALRDELLSRQELPSADRARSLYQFVDRRAYFHFLLDPERPWLTRKIHDPTDPKFVQGSQAIRDRISGWELALQAAGLPDPRTPEERTADRTDPIPPHSVWKGTRSYRKGAYVGETVPYELFVQKREGEHFTGHAFDNGHGRNRVSVDGEIRGNTLTWSEHSPGGTLTMRGTLNNGQILVTFTGLYNNGVTNEGDGELNRDETGNE
jgi:serine/threonine protein kinase